MHPSDKMAAGYIEALYFTDTGPDSGIDSWADLAPDVEGHAWRACEDFLSRLDPDTLSRLLGAVEARQIDLLQIGHDLWLTRNGHGAGFWDRGLGQLGDSLTTAAKSIGWANTYLGDDGLIYVY